MLLDEKENHGIQRLERQDNADEPSGHGQRGLGVDVCIAEIIIPLHDRVSCEHCMSLTFIFSVPVPEY